MMLEEIFLNTVSISVVSGIVGAALIAFCSVCRGKKRNKGRISANWICVCWVILAVRLLIPFNLPIAIWGIELNQEAETFDDVTYNGDYADAYSGDGYYDSHINGSNVSDFSGGAVLDNSDGRADILISAAWAWLSGVILFAVWQGILYILSRRRLVRWSRCPDETTIQVAKEIAERTGIKQKYRLLVGREAASPMLVGLFCPIVFIPDGFDGEKLTLALKHELTHLRRRDIWLKLFLTAANAVHWFNPLVWFIAARAEKDIEIACDEYVLANAGRSQRRAYCETILNMISNRRMPLSTAFASRKEDIMKRFESIFDTSAKRSGLLAAAIVLCSSLLLSGFIGCTGPVGAGSVSSQSSVESDQIVEIPTHIQNPDNSEEYMNEAAAMELINRYREENGLTRLETRQYKSAQVRLEEIEESFSHTRPDGKNFSTAYENEVVSSDYFVEAIGAGQETARQIVDEWLGSPHTRERLLDPKVTCMCVVSGRDGDGQIYWIYMACGSDTASEK